MALATIVTNLALLFRDMGSSAAIIQANVLTQTLKATVHWANVALGLSIGAAVAISGPFMAAVFHEPALAKILYLLAFVFPIGSFSIVHQALLERESRFRLVVTAEVIAALAGLMLAILAALLGAGVYSLVVQVFTSMLISTIAIVLLSDFRPSWNWSRGDLKTIGAYGGNLSVFNFLAYLARNTDSIVIGRLLGATALGIYSIAYRIMLLPVQNLTSVATRALFPIMSRQRDQVSEIAALYLKAVGLIAFLSAPMMAGLFALRELFVDVVLGEKWHSCAMLLAWLAPVGVIQSLVSTTGSVSMARGRTDLLLRLGVLGSLLQISGFLIGSRWGIEGVAAGYLCASVLNAVPALHFTGRLIGVTVMMLVRRVAPAMALALVMAGLLSLALRPVSVSIVDKRMQLMLLTALGASFYGAMALWLMRAQVLGLTTFLKLPEFKHRKRRIEMLKELPVDYTGLLRDKIHLPDRIGALRTVYENSKPFPHVVIDNLFSEQVLDALLPEIAGMAPDQWSILEHEGLERTVRMRPGAELGAAGGQLLRIVHSREFLYLLSEITGIWQLLPDPYLQGSGYALMRPGDYFGVHSDRSVAYETGLTRRLAMIIYLNKSWNPEYGGQLELWNSDATRCTVSIDPSFNKTVIFEVANPNYHGVPAPLACPADRTRQSFIVYYHTVGIDGKQNVRPHTSLFAPRLYGATRLALRSMAREVTPPLLAKGVRKLLSTRTLTPKVR